jgi:rubrerythrin
MSVNPFKLKPKPITGVFMDWQQISSRPYNDKTVHPYTKLRIILANGAEFEAVKCSHNLFRTIPDNDVRRSLAMVRRSEQQQQKRLSSLKPFTEDILQHTIGYEQLAVELTALLAKKEPDKYVKKALDFALLEDFDHLYRYADLLEMERGIKAEKLVGRLTEIMPGRPTVAEHRCPQDDVKRYTNFTQAALATKLNIGIITAAEQQTMNYYMNVGNFYENKLGRDLYAEIAQIEEQHVSLYGSLLDASATPFENMLLHEYTECYLYYSLFMDEKNGYVKNVFEQCFEQEVSHLHAALKLLSDYEHKSYEQVVGSGDFPDLLVFEDSVDYVREVLAKTGELTGDMEDYAAVKELGGNSNFAAYQQKVNDNLKSVASHRVIEKYISDNGKDYRFEEAPHPIEELANRRKDNTDFARTV